MQKTMNLTEALQRFNRKERHWLVRDALGLASAQLDQEFTKRVQNAVRLNDPAFKIDPMAWWAVDFHIDWLIAALEMLRHESEKESSAQLNNPKVVTGSQQDIDLVIASGSTLVLIEAKGVGSWSSPGFEKKVARLISLSPSIIDHEGKSGDVRVHFVLCSPEEPYSVDSTTWHPWMKAKSCLLYLKLNVKAEAGPFLRVQRCSAAGEPQKEGTHWQILADSRSNTFTKTT